MFERKEESVSFKRRLSRVFKLINGLEKGNHNVSFVAPAFAVAPYKPANSPTNYSLEAELKKAEALMYLRMVDRLK